MKLGAVLILILLLMAGIFTGFINVHYLQVVENQALIDPVLVSGIEGDTLTFEDGRVLELDELMVYNDWRSALERNDNRLEIEVLVDGMVAAYGNVRRTICGGTAVIRIPLIPRKVNRNMRRMIAIGRDITEVSGAQ